ncbi:MAG: hypothetical protein E5Y14_31225, partial [Mesorhizobium sp.]
MEIKSPVSATRKIASPRSPRSVAPPSVLPDISPTWGEIGSFDHGAFPPTLEVCESRDDSQSPPKWG